MIELLVKGPGELIVGLFDRKGKMLFQKRLIVSGPAAVETKCRLPVSLQCGNHEVPVVPVLIHQSTEKQAVTFAAQQHAIFTEQRCKELKVRLSLVQDAVKIAGEQAKQRGLSLSLRGK